jgi:hypothetical protein
MASLRVSTARPFLKFVPGRHTTTTPEGPAADPGGIRRHPWRGLSAAKALPERAKAPHSVHDSQGAVHMLPRGSTLSKPPRVGPLHGYLKIVVSPVRAWVSPFERPPRQWGRVRRRTDVA